MQNHTRHFLFLLIGLSFSTVVSAASLTKAQLAQLGVSVKAKPSHTEMLEADGMFLTTYEGRDFLLTSNGKLAFEVSKITNLWEARDIKAPEVNRVQFANLDTTGMSLEHLTLGDGETVVNALIDPLCGFCKLLLQDAKALVGKDPSLRFVFTIIPIQGIESENASVSLACLSNNEAYWRLVTQDFDPIQQSDYERECVKQRIASAFVAQQAFTPKATPVLYMPNGAKIHGLPNNLSKTINENL